jgi:hypothetical protein
MGMATIFYLQQTHLKKVRSLQAVEKGSPASLRSIASLQRIDKYAATRRFLARLASEKVFLNSLTHRFSTLCLESEISRQERLSELSNMAGVRSEYHQSLMTRRGRQ